MRLTLCVSGLQVKVTDGWLVSLPICITNKCCTVAIFPFLFLCFFVFFLFGWTIMKQNENWLQTNWSPTLGLVCLRSIVSYPTLHINLTVWLQSDKLAALKHFYSIGFEQTKDWIRLCNATKNSFVSKVALIRLIQVNCVCAGSSPVDFSPCFVVWLVLKP